MPRRLRPTAPIAADAILVGDPGRALLLAQELLEEPKMSNHARGLWGYHGRTSDGRELTIQATGMGGPSAAIVLGDLAELGVRRAARVGTCVALEPALRAGELLVVGSAAGDGEAVASPTPASPSGWRGSWAAPAPRSRLASFHEPPSGATPHPAGAVAADMQTATVLARGRMLGIAVAAT